MEDRSQEILGVATFFFILTWLTVGLRIYVRGILHKGWGQDDWHMFVTLIIFTMYLAFQIVAGVHGTGRHRWDLSDEQARIALRYWYLCEIFYVLSNCTLKIALGTFYLRVAVRRWHVWSIRLLMIGTVLFSFIYFFIVIFQCTPASEFWNNHPASNKCIPTKGITHALSVFNAMADWSLCILPFLIVLDLQMSPRTKNLAVGVLAFAAIGSTATLVRMAYIHTLSNGPDFLYATTDVGIWSTVELGIGITACSIATLRPLLHATTWHLEPPRAPKPASPTSIPTTATEPDLERGTTSDDLVPSVAQGRVSTVIARPLALAKRGWARFSVASQTHVVEEQEFEDKEWTISRRHSVAVVEAAVAELPPRLQLSESIYRSFVRGSIMSLRELLREKWGNE
ncbi:hypothetical protein DM02DRAFT_672590 [Periconia macrospinosa]|uniref:Rhodopsin domain-containing protein n=1 Tax=Periconia macrospinosa TaxID=97972 RepID=A0A2V1DMW5_9PLEO|nr:hypothetical protein DM02DRAFT_672590 [Periconia macrospinosa]